MHGDAAGGGTAPPLSSATAWSSASPGPCLAKGVLGAEKDGGEHGWWQRLVARRELWGSAALQLTLVPAGQGQVGECRGLLEARKRLEKLLEGSSSARVTDHKKLSPDTSKDLGVQEWEANNPHPTICTPLAPYLPNWQQTEVPGEKAP